MMAHLCLYSRLRRRHPHGHHQRSSGTSSGALGARSSSTRDDAYDARSSTRSAALGGHSSSTRDSLFFPTLGGSCGSAHISTIAVGAPPLAAPASLPARGLGHVVVTDRLLGVPCSSWSPAALSFSNGS